MVNKKKIVLGISCGDVNGIGVEIIIKTFLNNQRLLQLCTPVLYIPESVVTFYKKLYPKFKSFNYNTVKCAKEAVVSEFNIINLYSQCIDLEPGISTKESAQIAIRSLDLATQDLKKKSINTLLTLPVNKKNISTVKKGFVGHTEYLSQKMNNDDNLMLLCDKSLRIATLTNHLPISKVAPSITKQIIQEKISILIDALKIDFGISAPKIAVLGLNPHTGDEGLIGHEDMSIINPAVYEFYERGHLIYGPYSADGFFGSGNYKNFDAILAMYHDQALIPFKLMSFGRGVNYTAGLSMIRVSPDHGVGYDIAGKGTAQINSVQSAILLSIELYSNRKLYFDCNQKK
tara:strand:+ start:502 stop:1536 length:1035 start_codon:yes stop_codon:yes gene_type:complete